MLRTHRNVIYGDKNDFLSLASFFLSSQKKKKKCFKIKKKMLLLSNYYEKGRKKKKIPTQTHVASRQSIQIYSTNKKGTPFGILAQTHTLKSPNM